MDLVFLARIAAVAGIVLLLLAGVFLIIDRWGLPLGNLPGDIKFSRGNFSCAVPLVSSLLISILLTLVLNLLIKLINH